MFSEISTFALEVLGEKSGRLSWNCSLHSGNFDELDIIKYEKRNRRHLQLVVSETSFLRLTYLLEFGKSVSKHGRETSEVSQATLLLHWSGYPSHVMRKQRNCGREALLMANKPPFSCFTLTCTTNATFHLHQTSPRRRVGIKVIKNFN